MKYLDTKENSIEDSVTRVLMGEKKLDPVNPTAVKKKFDDRKDKDIDNDGDVDSTDKYLHKRRKAISKAVKKDEAYGGVAGMASYDPTLPKKKKNGNVRENVKDIAMMMRDKKYKGRTSAFDAAVKKKYPKEYDTNAVQDLIRKHAEMNEAMSGKDVAKRMMKIQTMKGFANKVAKMKTVSRDDLEKMLPDYIDGGDIGKVLKEGTWAMPDTPKLKMGLKKALQRPIMLGKEGDDATDTIRSFIGDDELYDDLYAAGMKNPKGDARPIIKKAMKRLGIKEEVELDENFRKLAMKGMGTATKKGARVGLKTDYYLPSNGDKSFGKIMRVSKDGYEIEDEKTKKTYKFKFYDPMKAKQMKENYDIGNDYAKHTLRVTPGQSEDDVDEMLGIMQKKTTSMREALAKVWGLDEGQSPFDEKITRGTGKKGLEKSLEKLYGPKRKPKKEPNKEEKDSKKTMMGGKQTPVQVDPKMEK